MRLCSIVVVLVLLRCCCSIKIGLHACINKEVLFFSSNLHTESWVGCGGKNLKQLLSKSPISMNKSSVRPSVSSIEKWQKLQTNLYGVYNIFLIDSYYWQSGPVKKLFCLVQNHERQQCWPFSSANCFIALPNCPALSVNQNILIVLTLSLLRLTVHEPSFQLHIQRLQS